MGHLEAITSLLIVALVLPLCEAYAQGFSEVDLLSNQIRWLPFNYAVVDREQAALNIKVNTTNELEVYNRVYTDLYGPDFSNQTLSLTYASNASKGDPLFIFEIIRNDKTLSSTIPFLRGPTNEMTTSERYLGSLNLGNTNGNLSTRDVRLPVMSDVQDVQFRFYVISTGPTSAHLQIENATIYRNGDIAPRSVELL